MGMLPGRTDQLSIRNLLEEKSLEMENQKRQTEFCQRAAGTHHVANRFNSTKLNYTGDIEREDMGAVRRTAKPIAELSFLGFN